MAYGYQWGNAPGYLGGNYVPVQQPTQAPPQQGGGGMPMMNPMGAMGMFGGGGGGAAAGGAANGVEAAAAANSAGAGGAGGGMGSLGALGPVGAIMAAVALTKGMEYRNPDSLAGKLSRTFNAPSLAQIKEDPKVGVTTALGVPFLNNWLMNDKAKKTKPEWESFLGL